jgi:hypothetical protein
MRWSAIRRFTNLTSQSCWSLSKKDRISGSKIQFTCLVFGSQLPRELAKIPPGSPKGSVLASVPGTEQAREAMIANQLPQTASVRRTEAKFEVRYDGAPKFQPIEGSSLEYAVNTAGDGIHAGARYCGCPSRYADGSLGGRRYHSGGDLSDSAERSAVP